MAGVSIDAPPSRDEARIGFEAEDQQSIVRGRALQLFEYLRALKNLITPPVRDLVEYQQSTWWTRDLPVGEGCFLDGSGSNPAAWLEVLKQQVPPPPEPPQELRRWLAGPYDRADRMPTFAEQLEGASGTVERFDACPQRRATWQGWIEAEWNSWATEALPKQRVQQVYGELFALRQRLEREGDRVELVWGHGLLTWTVSGLRIRRHVLVTRLELQFDPAAGAFCLLPVEPGTVLETDMLTGLSLPNHRHLVSLEARVRESQFSPWDTDLTEPVLQELAATLDARGTYGADEGCKDPSLPNISNASALYVRPRSGRPWHTELETIIHALQSEHPVPAAIGEIVAPEAMTALLQERQSNQGIVNEWDAVGQDLLFPLPANEEQKEIVRRLARQTVVTVQGPPGTGKSHTIANIICHLLAHGKRVLVTSHTERALRVLTEKLPAEIQPLCVSVLGSDSRAHHELANSVRTIGERLSWDTERLQRCVNELVAELAAARESAAGLRYRLREAAQTEAQKFRIGDRDLVAHEVARWVSQHEEQYGWLPAALGPECGCPLQAEQVRRLFSLAGSLTTSDVAAVRQDRPDSAELPTTEELGSQLNELACCEDLWDKCRPALDGWWMDEKVRPDADLVLRATQLALAAITEIDQPWLQMLLQDCLHSPQRREEWGQFQARCRDLLVEISQYQMQFAEYTVTVPLQQSSVKLREDLLELQRLLSGGRRPGRWFRWFCGRHLTYLLDGVRVNNEPISRDAHVAPVLAHVDREEHLRRLLTLWNNRIGSIQGPLIEMSDAAALRQLERWAERVNRAVLFDESVRQPLVRALAGAVPSGPCRWTDPNWLRRVERAAEAWLCRERLGALQSRLEPLRRYLVPPGRSGSTTRHALWSQLLSALDQRDLDTWSAALAEVNRLKSAEPDVKELERLADTLSQTAPQWTQQTLSRGGSGSPLTPPDDWEVAWNWRQADTWLRQLQSGDSPEELEHRLAEEEQRIRRLTAELVGQSAWLRQIDRTTDEQRRSLLAWVQAVKKIGKGTGVYAERYRREAREHMLACRDAVPVWVMPQWRVIENLRPEAEPFDVVIVDESSQSDIFSLVSLFRAKKAVVVGDDQQISPQAVGQNLAEVHELIDRHLIGVPEAKRLDTQASLYDTALRVFPRQLMLTEHFRCVPEIIQFSNDLCYEGRIQPLRLPRSHERFEPPIRTVRVAEGWRTEGTHATNEPEARALVTAIVGCCEKPEYHGRSMGVISLQGEAQARLIEEMLREELGEEQMLARCLICGDAYSFQGDERDVMFLSMVAAGNARIGALTRDADRQRFNVAASRARDQMWLFHSVDLEDLNPNCMRYRLLNYCLEPGRPQRQAEEVADRFESQFEREVYQRIVAQGYAVQPQVVVGQAGRRIDLVVEGLRSRLAVECDGDRWHGPERWEEDQARQAQLERIGWTFVRIRASAFYRNPDSSLRPLWSKLEEMKIEPGLLIERTS